MLTYQGIEKIRNDLSGDEKKLFDVIDKKKVNIVYEHGIYKGLFYCVHYVMFVTIFHGKNLLIKVRKLDKNCKTFSKIGMI